MSHEARAEHVGWATLAILLLLTALAYALVRHMLRPLVALRAGAVRYGQGDFSQPIVPRNRDELGDLAEQVNAMAARLHHMLDAKRQLLLAISHELRSPLARARMNAELIDESGERSALLRDLGEMRDLITDLLESERLADVHAGGHAALQTEPATLSDIIHEQCDAQAAAGTLALQLDETLPPLPLDRARMRLLLRNLVDNALRHGSEAAQPPQVSTARTAGRRDPDGARLRPGHGREPAPARRRGVLPRRRGPAAQHRRGRPGAVPVQAGGRGARGHAHSAQRAPGTGDHGRAANPWLSVGSRLASSWRSGRCDRKEPSMNTPRILAIAALALAAAAHAAPGTDVNLDGSTKSRVKKPTLATAANRQLTAASVPSVQTDPQGSVAAKADADMVARDARARGPRLVVSRQNLKGDDAARAIQQQTTPNTIDRATAYGDKDHTEQVTNLKVTIKK